MPSAFRSALCALALILVVGPALAGPGASTASLTTCAATRTDPDSFPDPFSRPSAALMAPGATRSFQIQPNGDLYNGVWSVRITAAEDGRAATPPHRIAYEQRWLPVAYWAEHGHALRWDFEAVAQLMPESPLVTLERSINDAWIAWRDRPAIAIEQKGLLERVGDRLDRVEVSSSRRIFLRDDEVRPMAASFEARVTNPDRVAHVARLVVRFAEADAPQPWREDLRHRPKPLVWGWADTAATVAIGIRARAEADSLARGITLAPGESRVIRFVFATHPVPVAKLVDWARAPHEQRVAETRAFWQREVARGMTLELGDPEVERAVAAARVVLLSLRERRSGNWVPLGGPFHYRDVWLRDGARAIQALALNGYVEESRDMARGFLTWQWAHGPFVSQSGQLDGTGQALWVFEQAMLRPYPAPDVDRFARSAWNAVEWCERVRAIDRESGAKFSNMLPKTDPHDAELVDAQLVGNDAWALAGYRSAER
ncbi:MAG TPA: hypothetical protein VMJ70_03290, partial [Candidatus Sulfotelmatobacter sp.]|nr:hypothetical protein [Candidatus Sulfotelmatobacter sp.]